MSTDLILIFCFNVIIHLIATLTYGVRITGVRTGRLAISSALFNMVLLVSRVANAFQGFFLVQKVEREVTIEVVRNIAWEFRFLLSGAFFGTALAMILFQTFLRIFHKAVTHFDEDRSMPRLILHSFSKTGIQALPHQVRVPRKRKAPPLKWIRQLPLRVLALNSLAVAILTVGSLVALYAAYSLPDFRLSMGYLATLINGLATVTLFLFVDPKLSAMTDDVIHEKVSDAYFFSCDHLHDDQSTRRNHSCTGFVYPCGPICYIAGRTYMEISS